MSVYSREDERAIRAQRLVDDWAKSGLLLAEQRDRIMPELKVELRRTNRFLRATLFFFGYLIISSMAGLIAVVLDGDRMVTWLALIASAASLAGAHMLVTRFRLYRFGLEESAAIAAASFFVIFAATIPPAGFSSLIGFTAATAAAALLFQHFGFIYAGVAATLLAPMIVLDLELTDTVRRLIAAIVLLTTFFIARERRQDHDPDYPADAFAVIEAVAWAALYLITNLKVSFWLSPSDEVMQVYWASYGLIWLVPAAGLWLAIRDRHRMLLNVNIVLAIITLLSNKPYLGLEQKPWDPIVFGVMLIAIVIAVRKFLASGEGGSRGGFVGDRLLASEAERLALAGSAAALIPGAPAAHSHESVGIGGGGRSGGAGATESF